MDYPGLPREADINICESFAFIVAITLVAPSAAGTPSSPTHVHARFCLVITAGLLNLLADAASRDFACQNGHQSFKALSKVLRHTALLPWVSDMMPEMSVRSEAT